MDFNEYQKKAKQTAIYPRGQLKEIVYPILGLTSEAGEVAGKLKKIIRDQNGKFNPADVKDIKKELGDVLWYLSTISTELGISLNDVAELNLEKLFSRKKRNVLMGNGDDR